ncbi:MAG: MlaD family protein [Gemmatimonadota bacterium]
MRRGTRVTWEQVRTGVVLILGFAVLAVGVVFIGQTGHVFGERYRLVTLMHSAAGLVPGAAVQLAGQNVGQVDAVELIEPDRRPESGEAVAVWLAINREVQTQIRRDSQARVRTQGLLGDRIIDIRPGTSAARVLREGDTLTAASALDVDRLFEEGAAAVSGLSEVANNLADLTRRLLAGEGSLGQLVVDDALYRRMVDLSASLDTLVEVTANENTTFGRLLRDDALYRALLGAVAAFDTLTANIASGEGTLGRMLMSDSLYVVLHSVVARSDSLLASLQSGKGSAGRLLSDERLYEELLRTVVELNNILAELREEPRRYIPPVKVF